MARVLKLLARGSGLFADREALNANARRFVGRQLDVKTGAWLPLKEPAVKDLSVIDPLDAHDYRHAVRTGQLWAADEDTARECGVKWDEAYQAAMDAEMAERDEALASHLSPAK